MARIINFSMEVTDEEFANFLSRASGADGRKVTAQVDDTEDEGPANASAPATDKNGVAWNERFHASSKAVNADGTWRRKRGLSPEETAAADAYDKGTVGNAPAETPSVPADSVAPTPSAPVVPSEPAPALPVGMPGLPAAAPAPTPKPVSYEELVALFGQAVAKDASVSANFAELYAKAGVTDPQVLNTDAGAEQRIALAGLLREIIEG